MFCGNTDSTLRTARALRRDTHRDTRGPGRGSALPGSSLRQPGRREGTQHERHGPSAWHRWVRASRCHQVMPSMQGHSPRWQQGHHSRMDTAETPLKAILEDKTPFPGWGWHLEMFQCSPGDPHSCPHPSWQSPAPAKVLPAQRFGEGPKITGLLLTHERTQGDNGLWAQHTVTVQAQVCKSPENHSVPLAAAPWGEGTAGTGGDTEPPRDNTQH